MKIIITENQIQFKYYFFTIKIPNKDIKYTFEDLRYAIGIPISFKFESSHTKIISRFGVLGKIVYHVYCFFFIDNTYSYSKNNSLTTINHQQNIERLLLSLQKKNYDVFGQLEKLTRLVNEPIPKFINSNYVKDRLNKLSKKEKLIVA